MSFLENRKEKKQRKMALKINSEEIGKLYKMKLYKLDLENRHQHFMIDHKGDNDNVYRGFDWWDLVENASFKPVMELIVYHSNVRKNCQKEFCYRELISRRVIPVIGDGGSKYTFVYDIGNEYIKNNQIVPIFTYIGEDYAGTSQYLKVATAEEINEYLEKYTNSDFYKNFDFQYKNFDAKTYFRAYLESLMKEASEEYQQFLLDREYTEREKEQYRLNKVKNKYQQYF